MRIIVIFILLLANIVLGEGQNANHIYGRKSYLTSGYCTKYLRHFESYYNIPHKLLEAVALNETGRYHKNMEETLPWPWSVNFLGKSYYFDSKYEAVYFVKKIISKGIKNIDVGCMQVNLHHHGNAFKNVNDAFDPKQNIAYAASLISNYHLLSNNWLRAVSKYHSHNTEKGHPYAENVAVIWKKKILEHKMKGINNNEGEIKVKPRKRILNDNF